MLYRHTIALLLAAVLATPGVALSSPTSVRAQQKGAGLKKQPTRGVWVKGSSGRLRQISRRVFQRAFKVKWTSRQLIGRPYTEKTLPGYSDGPGSFDINNMDAPQYVAPQYRVTRADRRAINGKTAPVFIGKVSKTVGYGLFARGRIVKGAVVGQYTGVVRNEDLKKDRSNGYTFTYDPFNQLHMVVDAKDRGNYMRFANHSAKFANTAPRLVYDEPGKRWHVLLVATKEIRSGDQVLFNYGHQYGWERFGINKPTDLKPR